LEIKEAIEEKFKVKIKKVATMNLKGKNKNMTIKSNGHILRTRGNQSSWKKAIVTLEEGSSIDMLGGEV
jgi:large subunit ribosomal protein L23